MDWIKKHMMLILVLVVVIVAGTLYGMSGGGTTEDPLLTTDTVNDSGSPTADTADRDLVETLLTLRAITLSGTIFGDPAFQSLQDFGTTIVPEPVGRPNPFAPLNRSQSAGQQTSTGSQGGPRR
jgi:hypothetical protein